jgi:hypothetical protein
MIPLAESAAQPESPVAIITASVVSIPSPMTSHSFGRNCPSRTAPPAVGPSEAFWSFLSTGALPEPSGSK